MRYNRGVNVITKPFPRHKGVRTSTLPLLGILGVCSLVLTLVVSHYPLTRLDVLVGQAVQSAISPIAGTVLQFISSFGNPIPAVISVLLMASLLWFSGLRLTLLPLALIVPAILSSAELKHLVNRVRPTEDVMLILQKWTDPSFPSSHVVYFTFFYGFLLYLLLRPTQRVPKWLKTFGIVATSAGILLIGISRIYVGAHWLTDVIGGYLVGMMFLTLAIRLHQKLAAGYAR